MATYRYTAYGLGGDEFYLGEQHIYGSSRLGYREAKLDLQNVPVGGPSTAGVIYVERGRKRYEMSNHLGNVLSVISDRRMLICNPPTGVGTGPTPGYYQADIIMATDYSSFGAPMVDRNWNSSEYKYGFNGQLKDDEWSGSGNHYSTEYRQYDSRLGRWMSLEPKTREFESPYAAMGNNPILYSDVQGDTVKFATVDAQNLFEKIYYSGDAATKAQLEVLITSDVVYMVDINATLSNNMNGSVTYDFNNSQVLVQVDQNTANKVGALGDELMGAYQFEEGRLGLAESNRNTPGTFGYDMEDEVESKRAGIKATNAVNALYGENNQLSATVSAFNKADTDPIPSGQTREQMIENYFKTDSEAKRYGPLFQQPIPGRHTGGNKMGTPIDGSGGYTQSELNKAVDNKVINAYIYRTTGSNGTKSTVRYGK